MLYMSSFHVYQMYGCDLVAVKCCLPCQACAGNAKDYGHSIKMATS